MNDIRHETPLYANSVHDVLAVVQARGFALKLTPNGPVLTGVTPENRHLASDALKAMLRTWRAEIIEELQRLY